MKSGTDFLLFANISRIMGSVPLLFSAFDVHENCRCYYQNFLQCRVANLKENLYENQVKLMNIYHFKQGMYYVVAFLFIAIELYAIVFNSQEKCMNNRKKRTVRSHSDSF